MKRLVTVLLQLFIANHALAEDAPLSVDGLNLRDAQLLVAGVAYGSATYHAHIVLSGKSPLYCAPVNASINGRLLWNLAEKNLAGPHEITTIANAAIMELKMKYPCKKK